MLNLKRIGHFSFSFLQWNLSFEHRMVTIWLLAQMSISDEGNSNTLLMEFLFFK